MTIGGKFVLIGLASLMPFALATWLLFQELGAEIRLALLARDTLAYHVRLAALRGAADDYRDHAYAALAARPPAGAAPELAAKTERALSELRAIRPQGGADFGTSDLLPALDRQWRALRESAEAHNEAESFWHNAAVPLDAQLVAMAARLNERGALGRDPEPQARHYAALIGATLPELRRRLSVLRALGGGAAPGARLEGKARSEAARTVALVERDLDTLAGEERSLLISGATAGAELSKPLRELEFEANLFLDMARDRLEKPGGAGAFDYFAAGSEAIARIDRVQGKLVPRLSERLEERVAGLQGRRLLILGADAACLLAAALFAFLALRSVTRSLQEVLVIADDIAAGNLSRRIEASTGDESGRMLQALGRMNGSLARMVREMRDAASLVADAVQQLAAGNRDLSQRTESQAAAIEQTAASMEELTASVSANAQGSMDAQRLAAAAGESVEAGNQAAARIAAHMREIEDSSRRVGEIMAIIDGIAFQTNILALNAAVEAARAGDQGRGFAVVASEVRALAQRCAASAKETRALLGDSAAKVESGALSAGEVCKSMTAIAEQVRGVDAIVRRIAEASGEQAQGIAQVSRTMSQLEGGTQQNAALVEEVVAATQSLADQSAGLAAMVQMFRLADGRGTFPGDREVRIELLLDEDLPVPGGYGSS